MSRKPGTSDTGHPGVHALLFLGEAALIDPLAERAIDGVLPAEARALNLEVFHYGRGERPLSEAAEALCQVGMFASERCVWIRAGAQRGRAKRAGAKVEVAAGVDPEEDEAAPGGEPGDFQEELFALVQGGLPAATTLLVSAPSLDARSRAYKWFAANGKIHDLRIEVTAGGRPDPDRTRAIVEERLRQAGVRERDSAAVREIVLRAGSNFGELLQEIDRVCLALEDPERLRLADVKRSMRDLASAWVFHLTDALGARRLADAERLVEQLLGQGEPPQKLVATLGSHVGALIEARALVPGLPRGALSLSSGDFVRGPAANLPDWFRKRVGPFRAYYLLKAAANFSPAELRSVHRGIVALDLALKSTRTAARLLFSRFLHGACRA